MSTNPYQSLIPLFNEKSALAKIEDFHSHINIIFHDVESKYYDTIHQEMWDNLQEQFNKLVQIVHQNGINLEDNLSLLDIGCGTGLSTEMLLQTHLGPKIQNISLLDTSTQMLDKAKNRIEKWKKPMSLFNTQVEKITGTFDVILVCSVIHHIPDLNSFFGAIQDRLNPGGILITMHDPLAEAIESSVFKNRVSEYLGMEKKHNDFLPRRIVHRIKSKWQSLTNKNDLIGEVNQLLLKDGITKAPLSHTEVWSVTDIHVEDLPYSNKQGVSIDELKSILNKMNLKKLITYCYFGTLRNDLLKKYQLKEDELSKNDDLHGRNFGSIWIKEK